MDIVEHLFRLVRYNDIEKIIIVFNRQVDLSDLYYVLSDLTVVLLDLNVYLSDIMITIR